jgi:2-phospho-L-lactate transferase/gluconeogenesis factor (CofD/UPF0052 family)
MALLGTLAALEEVEVTVQGQASMSKRQGDAIEALATQTHASGITHHYKQTTTHTVETDQRDSTEAEEGAKTKVEEKKEKASRCGCFGGLRLKKK